jgi:hypothetical protein
LSHRTSRRFRELRDELPEEIQRIAPRNFELLKRDPRHPSLHFKKIGRIYSVRVGLNYRAVGVERPDGILWFWIGPHDEYDRRFGG